MQVSALRDPCKCQSVDSHGLASAECAALSLVTPMFRVKLLKRIRAVLAEYSAVFALHVALTMGLRQLVESFCTVYESRLAVARPIDHNRPPLCHGECFETRMVARKTSDLPRSSAEYLLPAARDGETLEK